MILMEMFETLSGKSATRDESKLYGKLTLKFILSFAMFSFLPSSQKLLINKLEMPFFCLVFILLIGLLFTSHLLVYLLLL